MCFKKEFCTKGTGLGDNHIAVSADGVGMEDMAYREVKKKKVKNEGTKASTKVRTSI